MAVVKMKRVTIAAQQKDRKAILESLQRRGVVELTDLPVDEEVFSKIAMPESRQTFKRNIALIEQALGVLDTYCGKDGSLFSSLEGRKTLALTDYLTFTEDQNEMLRCASRIVSHEKSLQVKKAEIIKKQAEQETLRPWMSLPEVTNYSGTHRTATFIGSCQGEAELSEVLASVEQTVGDKGTGVDISILSKSKAQTCIFALFLKEEQRQYVEALETAGFVSAGIKFKESPVKTFERLQKEIEELEVSAEGSIKNITKYVGVRNGLKFTVDYFTMRDEKYENIAKLAQTPRVFILSGYLPEVECEGLQSAMESKFQLYLEFEDPGEDEDIPIILKNNKFSEPAESVVESYALPKPKEFDPTSIMSIFYYFLFGLMLSDAAYGLIMVIGCGAALYKFKNMESSMKNFLKMFMYCGISTAFWGFMFGSFFGDVVAVVSRTFFGAEVALKPLWFEPINEPMRMLMYSFLFGIIHLFVGLGIKGYICIKEKDYKGAVYDVGFWYMLLIGLIVVFIGTSMFTDMSQMFIPVPGWLNVASIIMAAIGAVGIVLTGGRESKSPVKRLLKGAYALYGATSWLSDILSYSRLLALGLATGVIATVINQMGSMMGGGIVGAIVFILVFIVGHTINLAINLLGAYVHTNRLQFVEFFGKFYEGGGRKFIPFGIHTKYYKIKEDN